MRKAIIFGKDIQLPNYMGYIVQGESHTENIRFETKMFPHLVNYDYTLTYKNSLGLGDTTALQKSYSEDGKFLYLDWVVQPYFTAIVGDVEIQITGVDYTTFDYQTAPSLTEFDSTLMYYSRTGTEGSYVYTYVPFDELVPGTQYYLRDYPTWRTRATKIKVAKALNPEEVQPSVPTIFTQYLAQFEALAEDASESADRASEKADEAEASALEIENMTVSSESLEPDEEATVEKTVGEVVNLHFGIPKGVKGDKGDKGDTGEQGEKGDGVEQILMYYAVTQTQDEPSSITSPTIPPMSSVNKYLWRKEVFIYTDSSQTEAVSLIAIYGDTGEDYPVTDVKQNGVSIVDEDGVADITIPSAPVQSISKNGTQVLPDSRGNVNLIIPTQASDIGALPSSTKYGSTLEVSVNTSTYVCSFKLKDQDGSLLGTEQTVDLPLEEMIVSGSYDSATKKIVLTLRNGNVIEIPVGDIISGLVTQTSLNTTLQSYYTKTEADNKFVEQVSGKGLSTNDYTTAEKNKLQGIEAGAEANVQSDWEQADSTDDSFIKNKPTIPTTLAELTGDSTHRTVTDAEKTTWSGKQDTISDLSTIRSNASAGKTASDTIETYGDIVTHDADEFGTYSKPSGGIPKTDLEESVQTSLVKADNAQPKETGKGLSTNDYDDTEKGKVTANTNARHTHGNKTVLDGITAQDITNARGAEQSSDTQTVIQAEIDALWED